MPRSSSATDPFWYKDAIIYELHVKGFFDSNNDGVGDFAGLTQKLDYLQHLGVTCLWLLPFYPSPLRDDGYDIARYEGVHPSYGTLRDLRHFLRGAHARGMQVITELVINHTSDEHSWFQAARRAAPGSSRRDFYVWSDTPQKYSEARVIFTDTETSNWTWDNVAKAYYWHRFFHHQPDLNFDNPNVRRAILRVMRFWLDIGVDGLRLDAVPYLFEREGTNCENLPETHEMLKQLRTEVDRQYANRMLLAEANQWPADVRPYFGDGDECHMAFHFPLMPRIFMALQQEDRHPIAEILKQTPEIPDACQWALFLRNHDELTLEMVTDEERDYMYRAYATDPLMRLNIGIRRRLAPLVENSRRRMELLTMLLFSLPGTPVIYYGDEIGMGDNIYLGDRNGVRTPMQWTSDRNAGFSRADPARLYAPPIMDPVYGYQAVNVEAQERSPFSLLNWMKRMIALRKQHKAFGRGAIRFVPADNRKVLAYARTYENETILVVANLARTLQPASLDLTAYKGLVPVEMLGGTEFPRIAEAPYLFTLAPYASYWFALVQNPMAVSVRPAPAPAEPPEERAPLLVGTAWDTLLDGHVRALLERDCLPPFLQGQRWFGGKATTIRAARFADWAIVKRGPEPAFLTLVDVEYETGPRERYFVPLALCAGPPADALIAASPQAVVARLTGARRGVLYEAAHAQGMAELLFATIESGHQIPMRHGRIGGRTTDAYRLWRDANLERRAASRVTTIGGEQSNTSIVFGNQLILKLFRRIEPGPNPDVEIEHQLAERLALSIIPAFFGTLHYERSDDEVASDLGILEPLVPNQGTAWDQALHEVTRFFERAVAHPAVPTEIERPPAYAAGQPVPVPAAVRETVGPYLDHARMLGVRTGRLHLALAADRDTPAFAPEPLVHDDLRRAAERMVAKATSVLTTLEQAFDRLPPTSAMLVQAVLSLREGILARLASVADETPSIEKIRIHGDYHLGQVLWTQGDFVILDFEGEPARPLVERRAKEPAVKDVAGMIRSFSYAALAGLGSFTTARPAEFERFLPWARIWQAWSAAMFIEGYWQTVGGASFVPSDPAVWDAMLTPFLLDKAMYELGYELGHRPDWLHIPLAGLAALMQPGGNL
jgi:maltose alpha-D-glucosyltransferase/alpha-amylase